jgi:hypothetical protein
MYIIFTVEVRKNEVTVATHGYSAIWSNVPAGVSSNLPLSKKNIFFLRSRHKLHKSRATLLAFVLQYISCNNHATLTNKSSEAWLE